MAVIKYDGLDEAILGISLSQPNREPSLVYDFDIIADLLVKRDGMSYEEAHEFIIFNMVDAHVGDSNPIFITEYSEDNIIEFDVEKPHLTLVK